MIAVVTDEDTELMYWLDDYSGRYFRRNGVAATASAIILGGIKLELALVNSVANNRRTPPLPAPLLLAYREAFGWRRYNRMVRFTLRISLRLCQHPDGRGLYRAFAQRVLPPKAVHDMARHIHEVTV